MTRLVRTDVTPRQGQVLTLMAEGLSAYEVALRLGISRRTVEATQRHIYFRLGLAVKHPSALAVALWAAGKLTIYGQDDV